MKNLTKKFVEKIWGISQDILSQPAFRRVRKLIIALFGVTVLLIGIAMIVLPGPAIIVIPLGLAILGTEFVWARRLLHRLKEQTQKIRNRFPKASNPPS